MKCSPDERRPPGYRRSYERAQEDPSDDPPRQERAGAGHRGRGPFRPLLRPSGMSRGTTALRTTWRPGSETSRSRSSMESHQACLKPRSSRCSPKGSSHTCLRLRRTAGERERHRPRQESHRTPRPSGPKRARQYAEGPTPDRQAGIQPRPRPFQMTRSWSQARPSFRRDPVEPRRYR